MNWCSGCPSGALGLVFFGFATSVAVHRLISPKPVLRVDSNSIHVWRYHSLRWEDFAGAEASVSSGEAFLVLHSLDDDAFRARFRRVWCGTPPLGQGQCGAGGRRCLPVCGAFPGTAQDMADRVKAAAP